MGRSSPAIAKHFHKPLSSHVRSLESAFDRLMATDAIPIRPVVTSDYSRYSFPAIYAISPPDDSRIVYVGISTVAAEGVAQRILDHCSGGTCSAVRRTLGISRADFQSYLIRILEIPDPRFRNRLEHFVIALLDPPANA
jgi:hypothetical protein